jgi:hypothetical protein
MDIEDSIEEHVEDIRAFGQCDRYEREARMRCSPAFYATRFDRHMAITVKATELRVDEICRRPSLW